MGKLTIRLEYRDEKSSKFWEAAVTGAEQTIRFGKIGTQGQTQVKKFASADEARAATEKVAAQKRKGGYVDAGAAPGASEKKKASMSEAAAGEDAEGAFFVLESGGVTANAIAAKVRGEGTLSKVDGRRLRALGKDGVVGVAIHPARGGWLGVKDSADGAAGIGAGEWSAAALLANHMGTDVVWFRVLAEDCAVAARFGRGSDGFSFVAGHRAHVIAWLAEQGVPRKETTAPHEAGKDALVVAMKVEEAKYRSGPDEKAARALSRFADALVEADGGAARAEYEAMDADARSLARGILRTERRGKVDACAEALAGAVVKKKLAPRESPKVPTLDEALLERAARVTKDDASRAAFVERLDAIEVEAESRSEWAQPTGVWRLGAAFHEQKRFADAALCYGALARRNEPHWIHVNTALSSLLSGSSGPIALTGTSAATIAACEKRLGQLDASAQDAILYNLACVYARAGDRERALDRLSKCRAPRKQNPTPEKDRDLALVWEDARFRAIVSGEGAKVPEVSVDDLEVSVRTSEVLAERGCQTLADVVALDPESLPKRVAAELRDVLAEHELTFGGEAAEEADEDEGDGDDDDGDDDDYTPPADRAVPRKTVSLVAGCDPRALVNRVGGLPNAPSADAKWPESESRPMQLVAQLVGKAAGGELDLGDAGVIQIFADMEGDYYEENAVVVHRGPCPAVLEAPAGLEPLEAKTMNLTPGADDRILELVDDPEDDDALAKHGADADAYEEASSHAWCDKIGGLPVGANLEPDIRDSRGKPMRLLLELVTFDDWFLWALFRSADGSELRLEVVRG